jgi:outer membrane protein assembly factor BamB
MTRRSLSLLILVLLLAASLAQAADWPCWRGANGDGVCTETGLNLDWAAQPPATLWSVPMADPGYSGPAIVGGVVYILDARRATNENVLRALDAKTGEMQWESAYKETGVNTDNGLVRSTPAVSDGKVYTFSKGGQATCFDAATGKILWFRQVKQDFAGRQPQYQYSSSPLVDGNKVIVVPGGKTGAVVALDKETGATLWSGSSFDLPGYSTPLVATLGGVRQYLVFAGTCLVGVDPDTGATLWQFPYQTSENCNGLPPLPVGGNQVIITSAYNHGSALVQVDGGTATQLWQSKAAFGSKSCAGILVKDCYYQVGENSRLGCFEVKTGKVMWTQPGFSNDSGAAGMLLIGETLLVPNEATGAITLVKATPDGYQELGKRPAAHPDYTILPPIVSDGLMLMRSAKWLTCVDLRAVKAAD